MPQIRTSEYMGIEPAWHRIGKVTGEFFTLRELFENTSLKFTIRKDQLYTRDFEPVSAWGIFRDDNNEFLGTVGERYTPIQHVDGFNMLDSIVGEVGGAHYTTAGCLGAGQIVWGIADLNKTTFVRNTDDETKHYLLFSTSHDGTYAYRFGNTATRVVCQNTLNMAISQSSSGFIVRHMPNAEEALSKIRSFLTQYESVVFDYQEKMNLLASKMINKEGMEKVFTALFPIDKETGDVSTRSSNNITKILELFEINDGDAVPEIRGTAYNLMNALVQYADHERSVRAGDSDMNTKRAEAAMFGTGNQFKDNALSLLLGMSQDLPPSNVVENTTIGGFYA